MADQIFGQETNAGLDGHNYMVVEANGTINVNVIDRFSEVVDLHLRNELQSLTLISPVAIDDTSVTVSSLATPVVGRSVSIREDTAFYQAVILTVVADGANWILGLDTPFDFPFTIAAIASEDSISMNVDGSITPIEFAISPRDLSAGTEWNITRIMFRMTASTSMDDGKFGGIARLTNGLVLRFVDGVTKNFFNAKDNGDMALHMYDVEYSDKAPAGEFGLRARRSFNGPDKNGVVINMCGDSEDELKLIVQDDLTGLLTFEAVAQGYVVRAE